MTERWAVAAVDGGGALLAPLARDGTPCLPVVAEPDLAEAVRSRPDVVRWVWRSTAEIYPRLLAASVRVERCYDIECAELLLLGHAGRLGEPRSAAAALARLDRAPVPPDPPARSAAPGAQSSLFEPSSGPGVPFDGLLRVYADQLPADDTAEHPDRMRLLTASESAGMLVAAEMHRDGLPWRADVHREVLDGLLGERYAGGGEPPAGRAGGPGVGGVRVARPPRSARRRGEGVRAGGRPGEVDPAVGAGGAGPSGGRTADRVQEALPDLDRARLVVAPGLGARGPLPPGVPAGRHGQRPVDDQRRRGPPDPQGDPAGRRRRRRVAARRGGRRPDGAPGAGGDLPRPGG